ncbi:3-keto-disaccharide hydrolase [Planctomicrobium piriforme]|uniref:3-keto-alpha-glucoside-1,2-lyase/3-keto-2-hydroxy-glucal hydratase domain-containing protein n=1 Tax=Planctomicrobium piriforme TaxID=1576369 RepID=A0A1I3BI41_9PLAN|nr:DUF1080 domain-containing protein [Planctomicrobium piriforme]SFH61957.1 protein of unknown function [Planctomicrobium piriforme]
MRIQIAFALVLTCLLPGCAKEPTSSPPAPPAAPQAETAAPVEAVAVEKVVESAVPANPVIGRKLLTPEEAAVGWISLFDGESLFGWKSSSSDINWTVADGVVTADSGPVGVLLTTVPFADFELVSEFRLAPGANSGLFLRSTADPKSPTTDGYEVNIIDSHPGGYLTGSLVGRAKANEDLTASGDWKTLRVVAQGKSIKVFHNEKLILDFTDDSPTARLNGLIGLQKNAGKIEFRKVNLKPLGMESIFNGKDLTGWRSVSGSKSEFTTEDASIHVVNGQGFLETEKSFKDFLFQVQAKTMAKELNSGFFFRALPGTEKAPSHGYEVQIHNGITDGDRNKPNNAGTGAIFRRVEARRVVSNDLEWCTITLVAAGPRIAVWVDGFQAVDWEDTREPDENPRKGKKLEAGHISLQGHDPTTDVWFRELKLMELPE